jgi:hypothetical protein
VVQCCTGYHHALPDLADPSTGINKVYKKYYFQNYFQESLKLVIVNTEGLTKFHIEICTETKVVRFAPLLFLNLNFTGWGQLNSTFRLSSLLSDIPSPLWLSLH